LLFFVLLWDGIPRTSKGLNEKFVSYLNIGGSKNGWGAGHQCASTILNESLMGDISILGRAFNKIKSFNKEISNIRGKG